eukprot:6460260-Prymnesium_polylepis.1
MVMLNSYCKREIYNRSMVLSEDASFAWTSRMDSDMARELSRHMANGMLYFKVLSSATWRH